MLDMRKGRGRETQREREGERERKGLTSSHARFSSLHEFGQASQPSSLPSQQSQTPSLTRERKMYRPREPLFTQ